MYDVVVKSSRSLSHLLMSFLFLSFLTQRRIPPTVERHCVRTISQLGLVLGSSRSDISPIHPLHFAGDQQCQIWRRFSTAGSRLRCVLVSNAATYLQSKTSITWIIADDCSLLYL